MGNTYKCYLWQNNSRLAWTLEKTTCTTWPKTQTIFGRTHLFKAGQASFCLPCVRVFILYCVMWEVQEVSRHTGKTCTSKMSDFYSLVYWFWGTLCGCLHHGAVLSIIYHMSGWFDRTNLQYTSKITCINNHLCLIEEKNEQKANSEVLFISPALKATVFPVLNNKIIIFFILDKTI